MMLFGGAEFLTNMEMVVSICINIVTLAVNIIVQLARKNHAFSHIFLHLIAYHDRQLLDNGFPHKIS